MYRYGKHFIIGIGLILFLAGSRAVHSQKHFQVELLQSDGEGVTFRCVFPTPNIRYSIVNNQEYAVLDFGPEFSVYGLPGEPNIPVTHLSLLAPPGAKIHVRVISAETQNLNPVRLLPNPAWSSIQEDMPVGYVHNEGSAYTTFGAFPERNISFETSFFRDWFTVRLSVFPVLWYPFQQQAVIWKKAVIRVDFSGYHKESFHTISSGADDALIGTMFLNTEQGKKWRTHGRFTPKILTSQNRLSSGTWYKIRINAEGIYKLDKKFFNDIGVKISAIQPRTIKIYNNGGQNLPILPDSLDFRDPENPRGLQPLLKEKAIQVVGEEDNRFDDKDYVLFYARSTRKWLFDSASNRYRYYANYYTEDNIYWLTFNDGTEGKRIPTSASAPGNGLLQTSFQYRYHYEKDEENVYQSGLTWIHKPLSNGQSGIYPESAMIPAGGLLYGAEAGQPVRYRVKLKGAMYNGRHRFTVSVDGQYSTTTNEFTQFRGHELTFQADPANLTTGRLQVAYSSTLPGSMGALDWFEMEYERKLRLFQNELLIYSPIQAGLYRYAVDLQGASAGSVIIWDITDYANVRQILPSGGSGDTLFFQDSVSPKQPRQYLIISAKAIRKISADRVVKDNNSDLQNISNSADYLIITHRAFRAEAERLANHRRQMNGYRVMVVDIQDVFDEFGAGLPDPTAVRDFLRYAYYRWQTPLKHDRLMYVLLMGDGDYDYRNLVVKTAHNWIPTYQIQSDAVADIYPINSREVDDAFTYLNDLTVAVDLTDGYEPFPYLLNPMADLAIGRIPCNNEEEARAAVDKIIQFELTPATEPWKNTITFVADDEYEGSRCESLTMHMIPVDVTFSDTLIVPNYFRKEKIYLSDFPMEMIGSTRIRRKARDRLLDMMNQGSVIINYVGHGNPKQLAHERVYVDETDFPMIRNGGRYFYFTNFSCSFARFDALDRKGGGERMVVSSGRGAIALFAATRVVYAGHHTELMDRVFRRMKATGKIGLAAMQAKILVGNQINSEKYHLLGDPAVTIPYAQRSIVFSSVQPSTLRALDKIRIEGYVDNGSGTADLSFNGEVLLTLTDRTVQKLIQSSCAPSEKRWVDYDGALLYQGSVKVEQGQFVLECVVPKDISYSGEFGKLVALAGNGTTTASSIARKMLIDTLSQVSSDTTGPQMTIRFENQQFTSGDPVPENPTLLVYFEDSSGINITNSTGHQIQMTVNQRIHYNLTPYYRPDRDDFSKGLVRLRLDGLTPGSYDATLTAFDNANNISRKNFIFQVMKTVAADAVTEKITLKNVMNFPNPLQKETHFTFITNHPSSDIEIRIFTISGRMIKKIESTATFGYNSIRWDGRDEDGHRLANGIYLYKIIARSQTDKSSDQFIGKMMIAK